VLAGVLLITPLVIPSAGNRMTSSGGLALRTPLPSLAASGDEGFAEALRIEPARVVDADSAEAWQHLPVPERGGGQRLPAWARRLARTLPHTTAAMLELDYLHRTHPALSTQLRGQLRWVAARTNGCRTE
jgi:hypothetical protein